MPKSNKMAAGLHQRGFQKGDVFAIYSPNIPEYAIAFYGTGLAGGIVTTINPLYTVDELTHPVNNPWFCRLRLSALDFFADGDRAAVADWDGDGSPEIFALSADERLLGVTRLDEKGRIGFPRLSVHCDYQRALRFEEEVEIEMTVARQGSAALIYDYQFLRQGEKIACGTVRVACCRFRDDGQIYAIPLPDHVAQKLQI